MIRVLLIEDDAHIRRFVRLALEGEGCAVQEATRLDVARAAAHLLPDLVLLDLGLPDGDGLDFIAPFRARSVAPVIVLSARGDEADKVAALDAGADDYLVKPFGVAELLARVRAQLRRANSVVVPAATRLKLGTVEIDLDRRTLTRDGTSLHCSPIEFALLACFVAHAGRVLTHRQILREVWGPGHTDHAAALRVYVGKLRHKLEADPARPVHLLTETGVGYRLEMG